jgi:hypothetical protein
MWVISANSCVIAVNWNDAKRRVLKNYREWIRAVCYPMKSIELCHAENRGIRVEGVP